ncbi:condensation domain-containing protein [Streptomyces sp. NPDC058614]|uniref:condensation domain-containing protein n=1 Tax=Streptomyces sp. NPDC058614 TaxID=3346557 RepID=UPI00365D9C44
MTVSRSSHAAISVVVDPGPPPYTAPWDLELRGPLDPARLQDVLGELACAGPGRPRLLRHGPDHYTLRFLRRDGSPAAERVMAGRIADLLTAPPRTAPLVPAQCAVLTRPARHRYEAVFLETPAPLDAGAVRAALRTVVAAHPQLHSRPDTRASRPAGGMARGQGQDPLTEGEFTDEAGFAATVASIGAALDADLGVRLRAHLARDRRPAGPRADRLAVIVHQLAVDAASWQILLEDLAAALGTAPAPTPAPASVLGTAPAPVPAAAPAPVAVPPWSGQVPDALAQWAGGLRELARDPDEARHWARVADRRSRAPGARRSAAVTPSGDTGDTGGRLPAHARHGRPQPGRHLDLAVDPDVARRITQTLARRLALTAGQVLTGAFALALARWQHVEEAVFDVRSDPRAGHAGLRRHVGRLTDVHPVHLTLDPALDPLGQLAAAAGPLAAGAGQAAGGAGFGACREWSPDPLLRDTLRHLAPAPACLVLHGPGELLPGAARPVPTSPPGRPAHRLEVRIQNVVGGRLHLGLDWVPDPAHNITDTSVAALGDLLREVLGELADAATAPLPSAFRATPQQSALYTGGQAQPGTGHHVEQLVWVWHGPLDLERFTAAWQSVADCETVLRTAFTPGPDVQLLVHSRATAEVTVRIQRGDDDLTSLLERDRRRGFDLRCPPPLRLTLLATEQRPLNNPAAPTRIVLTYHRALLDNWSAHILLREFYRAYLAGGTLPGGERRPDLRDYTAWIAARDPQPAKAFWADAAPPAGAASRPGHSAAAGNGLAGTGRSRLRLDPAETVRLARWAGIWGIAESSVLQAVWAVLIYRASGAAGPAPVAFAVTVPGRGIPLEGAARMLGPLRNPLPVSVEVDPAGTLPDLMRHLRDHALDMAAYEWLPADWIPAPARPAPARGTDPATTGTGAGTGTGTGTVIVFEDPPHPVEGLEGELAAQGIRAEFPGTVPARSVLPVALLAHHDGAGALVLTGVHDRDVLDEEAAAELLVQSALLLCELPVRAGESTTVAEVLELLDGRAVPPMAETPGAGRDTPLVTLRAAARERAGTVCLVPPPGSPATCYDLFARAYRGPQELLVLTADTDGARPALAARAAASPLLLGGFSGAGALACDLAGRIAADGGRPPRVVLASACADEQERARDLARALQDATAPDA